MYCSHCGNTINDDYTFCGTKLHSQGISTDQSTEDNATSQEKKEIDHKEEWRKTFTSPKAKEYRWGEGAVEGTLIEALIGMLEP